MTRDLDAPDDTDPAVARPDQVSRSFSCGTSNPRFNLFSCLKTSRGEASSPATGDALPADALPWVGQQLEVELEDHYASTYGHNVNGGSIPSPYNHPPPEDEDYDEEEEEDEEYDSQEDDYEEEEVADNGPKPGRTPLTRV